MLPSVVAEAARRFGDRPALVGPGDRTTTYRRLHRASDEVAVGLARRGVGRGDVVALTLASVAEYVVAYAAVAKLGAVTVGVNHTLAAPERAALLEVAGARVVLADAAEVDELRVDGDGESPLPLPPDRDRAVAVVFTSGTTGTPKGAVFTNHQLAAVTRIDAGRTWGGGGPMLASTSFAHVGFMTKLGWHLRLGMTLHLMERWRAADALRLASEHRMTSIGGVAPQIALMLRAPELDTLDLGSVRTLVVGGGPSSPALVTEARRRFEADYSIRYSSTESGGVGTGTAFDAPDEEALFTVGRPRPGVEVEVRDEEGRSLPAGEVGQVWLRSGAVMARYWDDPDATAQVLVGGWLRTGDLGRLDGEGRLTLAGRSGDRYVRGGENVHPAEVEAVLSSHPGVREVAVVERSDPVMGEVGVAVVVPVDAGAPPSLAELRHHAATSLATYKLPEDLRLVTHLPLTAMHKVDRAALRRSLSK